MPDVPRSWAPVPCFSEPERPAIGRAFPRAIVAKLHVFYRTLTYFGGGFSSGFGRCLSWP